MAAPSLIANLKTSFSDDMQTVASVVTGAFSVLSGDVVIATGIIDDADGTHTISISNSGTALTWNQQGSVVATGFTWLSTWSASVIADQSIKVIGTRQGGAPGVVKLYGIDAATFRGANGTGTVGAGSLTSGGPAASLVTGVGNSAIFFSSGDWTAIDGSVRTWRTINGITPTAANGLELNYFRNATQYTAYVGYWNDAGTAGLQTAGVSSPNTQKYSAIAVEIKGSVSSVVSAILGAHNLSLMGVGA